MPPEVVTTTAATPAVTLQGWLPLLGILVALLAPLGPAIYNGWIANRNAKRAALAAERAALAADDVADKLDRTDKKTSEKLDAIHSLTNSRLSAALAKIDRLERHLLETEGREPTGEEPPKPPDSEYPEGPALD